MSANRWWLRPPREGRETAGVSHSRLLVMGGTFDPPHLGHLVLAECARWQFGCERVLFIPAGEPYLKTAAGRAVTPAGMRLEMVRLATAENPAFVVDDREVRRPGPTYTVETLEELAQEGRGELVLVLGADAAAGFGSWREPGRIRELARVVVAPKGELAVPPGFDVVRMPRLEVSSSLIRERVRAGEPIRYLVPAAVEGFIFERGLYRSG